jgi:hypothetical protein
VPAISLQRPELLTDFVAVSDHVLLGAEASFGAELAGRKLVRLEVEGLRMDTRVSLVTKRGDALTSSSREMIAVLREVAAESR